MVSFSIRDTDLERHVYPERVGIMEDFQCNCRAPCCIYCGEFIPVPECDYDYCVEGKAYRLQIQELTQVQSTMQILIDQQKREIKELNNNGTD